MTWEYYEQLWHRPLATWQSGGVSRLLDVGAVLSDKQARFTRALSQSVLYGHAPEPTIAPEWSADQAAAFAALQNIIFRSDLCPIDPVVEEVLASNLLKLSGTAFNPLDAMQTIDLVTAWSASRRIERSAPPLQSFDDDVGRGAGLERRAWELLQTDQYAALQPWVHVQASRDLLLSIEKKSATSMAKGGGRVDFVISPPWCEPLIWELHGVFDANDRIKSQNLRGVGWKNVQDQRASDEPFAGTANRHLAPLLPLPINIRSLTSCEQHLIAAPWVAAQIDIALTWLLMNGLWSNASPTVQIVVAHEFTTIADAAIAAWTKLVIAVQSAWGLEDDDALLTPKMTASTSMQQPSTQVAIDPSGPTYLDDTKHVDASRYLIRRSSLPVDVRELTGFPTNLPTPTVRPIAAPPETALHDIMRRLFAKPSLRPGQAHAIQQAFKNPDSLILFPTGYGKSLVFQLASMLLPGLCIVVEPYRALIDDQERNLLANGINRVSGLHSDKEIHGAELERGLATSRLIYVTAERLHVADFTEKLVAAIKVRGIGLLAVDEAHTVSQFGHSFRPAYLDISERLDIVCKRSNRVRPNVVALTATAAQTVIKDIGSLLKIASEPVSLDDFSSVSFARQHHDDSIVVLKLGAKQGAPKWASASEKAALENAESRTVLEQLTCTIEQMPPGQGIIFCPTPKVLKINRRQRLRYTMTAQDGPNLRESWINGAPLLGARDVSEKLSELIKDGKRIGLFTGGNVSKRTMASNAARFSDGKIDIMVATSAFGTGIDLQGVRWTVHLGMPNGLEAYYQESGRAGRDGMSAYSVLLYDPDSEDLHQAMFDNILKDDPIRELQDALVKVHTRGSLTRQLGLLIGEGRPQELNPDLEGDGWFEGERALRTKKLADPCWKPSFIGYRLEAVYVSKPLHEAVMNAARSEPFTFSCHEFWDDLVCKAVHRLVALKIIEPGFEHKSLATTKVKSFVMQRCDTSDDAVAAARLAEIVRDEIARTTTSERAEAAYATLMQHLTQEPDPARRLTQSSAMLLRATYRVVYETRIKSLEWLRRYATEPDLSCRRQLLEDYFAPNTSKRSLINLCTQKTTIDVLKEAVALSSAMDAPRAGTLGRAASEYPGALVPSFLLALLALRSGNVLEAARYVMPILAGEEFALEIRLWCLDELLSTADRHAAREQLLNCLGRILSGAPNLTAIDVLMRRLIDEDGCTELGQVVVEDFISRSLGDRK
jgi:superfamily II DNA helicase RecQ